MTLARHLHYTLAEYLALETASAVRHEYLDGEIYAMAGGTPAHAVRAAAVIALLRAALAGRGCVVATSDLRVRIVETGLSTYPDVTVVCGGLRMAADDPMAVTNPALVVEVTSDSTEEYDRGAKLAHYQQAASVRAVLIVSHRARHLTLYRRSHDFDPFGFDPVGGGDGSDLWRVSVVTDRGRLDLDLGDGRTCALTVEDVYADAVEVTP